MKDITFPTFTVAKYIDPWTSWVPACSQTQVLFIVGILSLLTFNGAYHCRVLAVSLMFTHCTMVILEWTFMDPWTSWISYVSSIYISLFHRSSELWLKVSRPVSLTLLFIGLIGTAGVFEIHLVSLLFTHCHMVLLYPTLQCTASLKYNVYSGSNLILMRHVIWDRNPRHVTSYKWASGPNSGRWIQELTYMDPWTSWIFMWALSIFHFFIGALSLHIFICFI